MNASKANKVREAIATAFPAYADVANEIKIVHNWDRPGDCMIFWEEGPYNWTLAYSDMIAGYEAKDEEFGFTHKPAAPVPGVGVEPYFSYALSIWSED